MNKLLPIMAIIVIVMWYALGIFLFCKISKKNPIIEKIEDNPKLQEMIDKFDPERHSGEIPYSLKRVDTMMFNAVELETMTMWLKEHVSGCEICNNGGNFSILQHRDSGIGIGSEIVTPCLKKFDFTDYKSW